MSISLPPPLLDESDDAAVELVRGYMAPAAGLTGGVAFTGSLFDTWGGGGAHPKAANTFTDADINAVAMLSVEVRARAVIEVLIRQRASLSTLLEQIPTDVDLHEAPAQMVAEGSPAWRLWEALHDIGGIGPVSACKLCARKRPRLLPVYDEYAAQFLGPLRTSWEALRQSLSRDGGVLARRLRRIGDAAGATDLSVLRIFDVIAWRASNPGTAAAG